MQPTITVIKPRTKNISAFQYPNSGQIKIKFASNVPVDIFILPGNIDANAIGGPSQAISAGALAFQNRVTMPDQSIPLPSVWQAYGWQLLIGNPTAQDAPVTYEILEGA